MTFISNTGKLHREDAASASKTGRPKSEKLAEELAWLKAFKARNGRPLRVLHIGNIANNAYLNAKMLRRVGIEADVLSYHYNHVMALPEWEDIELRSGHGDDNNPQFARADLEGYHRPPWFFHGPLVSCIQDIENRHAAPDQRGSLLRRAMQSPIRMIERWIDRRAAILLSMFVLSPRLAVMKTANYCRKRWARLPSVSPRAAFTNTVRYLRERPVRPRGGWPSLPDPRRWLAILPLKLDLAARVALVKSIRFLGRYWLSLTSWRPSPLPKLWRWTYHQDLVARNIARRIADSSKKPVRATSGPAPKPVSRFEWKAVLVRPSESIPEEPDFIPEPPEPASAALEPDTPDHAIALITEDFSNCFPHRPDRMTSEEILPHYVQAQLMLAAFRHYDIVQCYATEPLHALLNGKRPYVAFEHGTLRDFTMGDDRLHRMTALAYRRSDHAFITNGDCLDYAKRLEIPRYSPIIHPVDVEQHRRDFGDDLKRLREEIDADVVLFCPIRHDWAAKGTDVHLRALPLIKQRTGKRVKLVLARWGAQLADSERLLDELGCAGDIAWRPSMCRITMIKYLRIADVVLDQMALPHFGATAPQSIAAGTPVISSYDPESTRWIIPEPAPILPAFSPEDVAQAVLQALDPAWRADYKERARLWTDTYHHPKNVIRDHLKVYKRILDT